MIEQIYEEDWPEELQERLSEKTWKIVRDINFDLETKLLDKTFYTGTRESKDRVLDWILVKLRKKFKAKDPQKSLNETYKIMLNEREYVVVVFSEAIPYLLPMGVIKWE